MTEKPTVTFVVNLGHTIFATIAIGMYARIVLMKRRVASRHLHFAWMYITPLTRTSSKSYLRSTVIIANAIYAGKPLHFIFALNAIGTPVVNAWRKIAVVSHPALFLV